MHLKGRVQIDDLDIFPSTLRVLCSCIKLHNMDMGVPKVLRLRCEMLKLLSVEPTPFAMYHAAVLFNTMPVDLRACKVLCKKSVLTLLGYDMTCMYLSKSTYSTQSVRHGIFILRGFTV